MTTNSYQKVNQGFVLGLQRRCGCAFLCWIHSICYSTSLMCIFSAQLNGPMLSPKFLKSLIHFPMFSLEILTVIYFHFISHHFIFFLSWNNVECRLFPICYFFMLFFPLIFFLVLFWSQAILGLTL